MSYIAYFNGSIIDISDVKPIAYIKQVNDIARLDTRNTNFTHKFVCPFTSTNKAIFENVFFVGNNSNIPYLKNEFYLLDTDSNTYLIYKGFAVLSGTTNKGYEINVYDGIIDFYKAIENKKLSEIGISELNHIKNIQNIIDSWDDPFAYKYILADYNGKLYTSDNKLNADYLVPSARVSYLFQKIHEFAGFTYSGTFLDLEKFTNLYLTYPKPIPTAEPITTLIQQQDSSYIVGSYPTYYWEFGQVNGFMKLFPTAFNTTEIESSNNFNQLKVKFSGYYKITMIFSTAQTDNSDWVVSNYIVPTNTINAQTITKGVPLFMYLDADTFLDFNTMFFQSYAPLNTKIELVQGYSANFEEALIDFSVKDFYNEIIQHFGVTAFKDKYTNHITYLTLDEILQTEEVLDLSENFVNKENEKYIISNYAQKNNFRYRYSSENASFNNGFLKIDNENLQDETTVFNSKIYSPENLKTTLLTHESNVYKIWDKNIKDNNEIEYKELDGRFYFVRSENKTLNTNYHLKSEILNQSETFDTAPFESFYRLNFQHIIYDNYKSIESMLFKAKIIESYFWLNSIFVSNFDFKKLVYVKQLGGYFLVNKIVNFIKGQKTKLELIKLDYLRELENTSPDYFITLDNVIQDDCELTFEVSTDIPQPTNVNIIVLQKVYDIFGGSYFSQHSIIDGNLNSNEIVKTFESLVGGIYKFKIQYSPLFSSLTETEFTNEITIAGSCYVPPPATLTYITITNLETISVSNNSRKIRATYISDLSVDTMGLTISAVGGLINIPTQNTNYFAQQNGIIEVDVPHSFYGSVYQYQVSLISGSVTSNIAISTQ